MIQLAIPDRHLGLIPRVENETLVPAIAAARHALLAHFDLERILEIAGEQGGQGRAVERESGRAGHKETRRQGVQIPISNLQDWGHPRSCVQFLLSRKS